MTRYGLQNQATSLRTCTHPDWNGWIFSYNEEIHKLSYDELIDIKIVEKNPSFQICDSLDPS